MDPASIPTQAPQEDIDAPETYDNTWAHLAVSVVVVVVGFGLAIALLRNVNLPADLDLTTPIVLFLASLTAEYRLLRLRKQSLHRVIYKQDSLLGRLTSGRITAMLAAFAITAPAAVAFTIWAVSADLVAIGITVSCTLVAAAGLALVLDGVGTQALDPHARYIAIALTGSVAGVAIAAFLGYHIWITLPPPSAVPEVLEKAARQLGERNDVIGLIKTASDMMNDAQLIVMNQIPGVGLKVLYVGTSVMIVFLIVRSALVLVAAQTVAPFRLPRGPEAVQRILGLAAAHMSILAVLVIVSLSVESLTREFVIPAGDLAQINRVVGDAYGPVHDAAAGFSARHLHDPSDGGAAKPDPSAMERLVREELLAGLEQRLQPAIDIAQPGAASNLQETAAKMIAQTLAASDQPSLRSIEDANIEIARGLCTYFELGWLRCWLVKAVAGSAPSPPRIQLSLAQQELALHAAIERAAVETKLQLVRTALAGPVPTP